MSAESDNSELAADDGTFDVIRGRLSRQSQALYDQVQFLNQQRIDEFGQSDMSLLHRTQIRTEHNCVARDIVQIGDSLLFGYNVFIGLKSEVQVSDVFSIYTTQVSEETFALHQEPIENTFLSNPRFQQDFSELYQYYKQTKLVQIMVRDEKLLAAFQIGERLEDLRVFRWQLSASGYVQDYIDNRGERDVRLPASHDFEWLPAGREQQETGRFPHMNILDEVFVETIGGNLTIKVENNTESGEGLYAESVDDETQSIDDAQILYGEVGRLILLKIRPYREETWRYFVFNRDLVEVRRLDAIGESCVSLPEDHGIIFPGGYYLQTGQWKNFDHVVDGFKFKRKVVSPNGEDVLYLFYKPSEGLLGLLTYNMIEKRIQNPIYGHGYARNNNGHITLFSSEAKPTRVHPMQLWSTPFFSDEFQSQMPQSDSPFVKIGNPELVRGISDILSICRVFTDQNKKDVHEGLYAQAKKNCETLIDQHYWLVEPHFSELSNAVKTLEDTIGLVLDEFEKVKQIRAESSAAVKTLQERQQWVESQLSMNHGEDPQVYALLLGEIRQLRGRCMTVLSLRYVSESDIEAVDSVLQKAETQVSEATLVVLSSGEAFENYNQNLQEIVGRLVTMNAVLEIDPLVEEVEVIAKGLDVLSELVSTLESEDAQLKTSIIQQLSVVYSKVNKTRAEAKNKRKSVHSAEATAEFAAQLSLLSQSIDYALSQATTPDETDEALAKLLVQLETLESQMSEHDEYLAEIMEKRDVIMETFESHKQQLMDRQQQKALRVFDAAKRMLKNAEKKAFRIDGVDTLMTYFAADPIIIKIRSMVKSLFNIGASVQAEEVAAGLKHVQDHALRQLRDASDLYQDGGKSIRLGQHQFSVNQQELDVVIVPRDQQQFFHITGTDYYELIHDPVLQELEPYWGMSLKSESHTVYRGEYLAYMYINQVEVGEISQPNSDEELQQSITSFAANRYTEGYVRGVHDHDAAVIAQVYFQGMKNSDGLEFPSWSRAVAALYYAHHRDQKHFQEWRERALAANQLQAYFNHQPMAQRLAKTVAEAIERFVSQHQLYDEPSQERGADNRRCSDNGILIQLASEYLVSVLMRSDQAFVRSASSIEHCRSFKQRFNSSAWNQFQKSLRQMAGRLGEQWHFCAHWIQPWILSATSEDTAHQEFAGFDVSEMILNLLLDTGISFRDTTAQDELVVSGLIGDHNRIQEQKIQGSLSSFRLRLADHVARVVPAFEQLHLRRQGLLEQVKSTMKLDSYKAKPLSSFVRNRLVNEAYLPIIGDNLAKQMGASGANKRTDLMGLLMMISPPGYGKTTLMEYVADRLGLIFMKINCPALGHDVISLDESQAPNATAKQELMKLNLALEMGNNVMLYLDDIQHTHPEFLQKFISLCDGTRRIEGVWQGQTKTYDMRGKKFCVVMAGNPYTESGEVFKIPDMLANRADIYNLGDILGGMDEPFKLSYIENALTSNAVLSRLALGPMQDIYTLIKMAQGQLELASGLQLSIGSEEQKEMMNVLQKMFRIQTTVLQINQEYIASAAQNDQYRVEPPFKLQGSYRNMNKMTEKVTSVMTDGELEQMIDDHYLGEAQLLTSGSEDNLLKLKKLRGTLSEDEDTRWQQICTDFLRNKALGGKGADVGQKVVVQLADLVKGFNELAVFISDGVESGQVQAKTMERHSQHQQVKTQQQLALVVEALQQVAEEVNKSAPEVVIPPAPEPHIQVINQPIPGISVLLETLAGTIEHTIFPLVRSLDKKLEIDIEGHRKLQEISQQLRQIATAPPQKPG